MVAFNSSIILLLFIVMLSSPTPPNPFDSFEQHARQNPVIASFEQKLQSYALILLIGLLAVSVLLVCTWLIVATRTPDYKLGTTLFQVVTPVPFSQVQGVTEIKVNLITATPSRNLKAFVKAEGDRSNELEIREVGKSVIQITGTWNSQTASSDLLELSLYDVSQPEHPMLVSYTKVPVTIVRWQSSSMIRLLN